MDKINEKLAEIARKKQEMEAEIAERIRREYEQAMEPLAHQESVLKEAASILGVSVADLKPAIETPSVPSLKIVPIKDKPHTPAAKGFGEKKYAVSLSDASAMAMVDKGKALSVGEVSNYLAEMGITPSRSSLRSILIQYDKRFKRISTGVYDLVDRKDEEARFREEGQEKTALRA